MRQSQRAGKGPRPSCLLIEESRATCEAKLVVILGQACGSDRPRSGVIDVASKREMRATRTQGAGARVAARY